MDDIQKLTQSLRHQHMPHERGQAHRRLTRYSYRYGPMYYLGQQIVRAMQDAGYPAKIFCCFRDPDDQEDAFERGVSRANSWQSPHQYYEAVDIVHASKFWNVSSDFWDHLHAAAHMVEDRFGVTFEHGYDWGWDKAHVEFKDWRSVRDRIGQRVPTQAELDARFQHVLPKVWKQYKKSRSYFLSK